MAAQRVVQDGASLYATTGSIAILDICACYFLAGILLQCMLFNLPAGSNLINCIIVMYFNLVMLVLFVVAPRL